MSASGRRRPPVFRDAPRADPALVRAHAELERQLARAHPDDREAYSSARRYFVDAVLARVRRALRVVAPGGRPNTLTPTATFVPPSQTVWWRHR